jgi:hypothetical protein
MMGSFLTKREDGVEHSVIEDHHVMVGVVRGVFGEVFISPLLGSNIRYIRAQG